MKRRVGTWKPKNQAERDWLRGVRDACELVGVYDATSSHPYRLGDCVLSKLNIITRPRRKAPASREPQ